MASTDPASSPAGPGSGGSTASELTAVVRADNPSPMTLEGTNTYVVAAPDAEAVVLVDPGPAEGAEEHLEAVLAAAGGRPVELILLTHRHGDHTGAVDHFVARTGAPVRAGSPDWCRRGAPLVPGERIPAAGAVLTAWHTPGHTSDSYSFALPDDGTDGSVLTGDTVLGRGTTVLDHPDGTLADYLASLQTLIALGDATVLPAHGPALPSIARVAEAYRDHRHERLEQVRRALAGLAPAEREGATVDQLAERLVAVAYPEVDGALRWAALMSLRAQLTYLAGSSELG